MFSAIRTDRSTRRRFTVRIAAVTIAAIIMLLGLWGMVHADDLGAADPAQVSVSTSIDTPEEQVVAVPMADLAGTTSMIGLITCILGLLCGLALATVLFFARRSRPMRLQRLRSRPAPIVFSPGFGHRGKHRFGLLELNLLRI